MLNILGSTYLGRDRIIFTARKRSCGKVMFLQVSVILFTGGCLLPERGGACSRGGRVSGPGGACSQGVPAPGGVCSQGVPALGGSGPGGVPGGDPPTVTAAGGTHPTGMHSCICLTSLMHAKWNFPLNFRTMRKLSDLYSGIFQNSLTCAKWNFPLNFRTMRKLSDLYSRIFQTQSSGCASGVDLFRNFTKLKILNI